MVKRLRSESIRHGIYPLSDSAQIIRTARLQAQIGQSDLAKAVGKSKDWLAKRELGFVHLRLPMALTLMRAIISIATAAQNSPEKLAKTADVALKG